jgi:redox-sensing transcriptional repressor
MIVGAGKIGAALAQYAGFRDRGFAVVGVYDIDPARIGRPLDTIVVKDQRELDADIRALHPDIVLVAVPTEAAQAIVDRVTKAGVRGVLNFAPAPLHAPAGVALRSVDMALELEILSYALTAR